MTGGVAGGIPDAPGEPTGTVSPGEADPALLVEVRRTLARRRRNIRWLALIFFAISAPLAVVSFEIDTAQMVAESPTEFWFMVNALSSLVAMSSLAQLLLPLPTNAYGSGSRLGPFTVLASAYLRRQAAMLGLWRARYPGCDPLDGSRKIRRGPRWGRLRGDGDSWSYIRLKEGLLFRSRRIGEEILVPSAFAHDQALDPARLSRWARSLGITGLTWQGRDYDTSVFGLSALFAQAAGLGAVVQIAGEKAMVYHLDPVRSEAPAGGIASPAMGAASSGPGPEAPAGDKAPTLAGNVAATVVGTGVAIVVQIGCLPLLLDEKALGLAAWGVVGLQTVVQGVVLTLDLGLGAVVGRELARLAKATEGARASRDLVRTLEIGYWGIGAVAAAVIAAAAPWIAVHWVAQGAAHAAGSGHSAALPPEAVARALRAMGVVAGLLLPGTLYTAVLAGLQRQVGAQVLRMGWSLAVNVGAVVAVRASGAGLEAFFAVQMAATLLWTGASAALCWSRLPGRGGRWAPEALRAPWRFAAGLALITVAGMVLVQLDKVALSYLVPLELAGAYFVAYAVGTTPLLLVKPLFAVIFPRFAHAVATPGSDLAGDFHRNAQIMAVLVLPLAAVVGRFGVDLVQVWTGNPDTAALAGPLAGLLVLGTALHALMHVPYALQLAHGWVRVSLRILAVVLAVMIPGMAILVWKLSVTGAALGWLLMHALQLTLCVASTHGRLLPGERRRWLWQDVALPLGTAAAVAWLGRAGLVAVVPGLLEPGANRLAAFTAMGAVGLCVQIATVMSCDRLRAVAWERWRPGRAGP
jgi:O-antigen/teichoic acid export membrane protein